MKRPKKKLETQKVTPLIKPKSFMDDEKQSLHNRGERLILRDMCDSVQMEAKSENPAPDRFVLINHMYINIFSIYISKVISSTYFYIR